MGEAIPVRTIEQIKADCYVMLARRFKGRTITRAAIEAALHDWVDDLVRRGDVRDRPPDLCPDDPCRINVQIGDDE